MRRANISVGIINDRPGRSVGLSVIELVVAVAIIFIIMVSVFTVVRSALLAQRAMILERRATLVAEEGLAVARFERDADWDTFAAEPLETVLYPTFSGGSATLEVLDPGAVDDIFTRTVTLSSVYRDLGGNIAEAGVLDSSIRRVAVEVGWQNPFGGTLTTMTLEAYLADIGS